MINETIELKMYRMIAERCQELAGLFNALINCKNQKEAEEIRERIMCKGELLGYLFRVSEGKLGDNKEPYTFLNRRRQEKPSHYTNGRRTT